MKNVLVNTEECLSLWEDFKKEYVSLDEILDKYDYMHDEINFLKQEINDLKMQMDDGQEVVMTETIIIKVSKEFKEQLEREANEKNINLSSYIRLILSERDKK